MATTDHPLARLTAAEIDAARELLTTEGHVGDATRFASLLLEEPPKAEVLAFDGSALDRRVRAMLLDTATGASRIVTASLTRGEVDEVVDLDPEKDGQPPILLEEFVAVDEIVKADPG